MILLMNSVSYGKTQTDNNISDMFEVSIISNVSEDDKLSLDEIKDLIQEFKDIMSIPENERTTDQWKRSIDIIFTVYYGANIKDLYVELQNDIDKYNELTNELQDMLNELDNIYESQKTIYDRQKEIQDDFEKILKYKKDLNNNDVQIISSVGYTINLGLSVGIGLLFPISDYFSIGGYFDFKTDFKEDNIFTINFMLYWGI